MIPDDSQYAVGGIGLLGTRPGEELVEDCDTLFMIGTNFPYTQHLPQPGKVRVVQIEADPVRAGVRMPTEVPVIGDARESLQALIPLLTRKADRGHLAKYQKAMAGWRSDMDDLENPKRSPIAPQYPMGVIHDLAADDAVLTCDSGTIATWLPGTGPSAAAGSSTCRAIWRRWPRGCPTRSGSSTPSRAGR